MKRSKSKKMKPVRKAPVDRELNKASGNGDVGEDLTDRDYGVLPLRDLKKNLGCG